MIDNRKRLLIVCLLQGFIQTVTLYARALANAIVADALTPLQATRLQRALQGLQDVGGELVGLSMEMNAEAREAVALPSERPN